MSKNTDGEKIAVLEANMKNIDSRLVHIEGSIKELHGKMDAFTKILSDNYVPIKAFDEYKDAQSLRDRNKNLEKVLWLIVGSVITGLIAFFLRELRI